MGTAAAFSFTSPASSKAERPSQTGAEDTDTAGYLTATARQPWHLTTPTCAGRMSVTRAHVTHSLAEPTSVVLRQSGLKLTQMPLCSGFAHAHAHTRT